MYRTLVVAALHMRVPKEKIHICLPESQRGVRRVAACYVRT
jgi:hypothetical protein